MLSSNSQLSPRFISTPDGNVDLSGNLKRISSGVKFPHRNDGGTFKNLEGLLPDRPSGYYREFVHPSPSVRGPGAMRLIWEKITRFGLLTITTFHMSKNVKSWIE